MPPSWRRSRELTLLQAVAFDIPPVRSKPTHEKQYDEDDQDDADDADAAVTEAVAVAAEAATEAAKQEDDEDDDEYEPKRHDLSPVAATHPNTEPLQSDSKALKSGSIDLGVVPP
jgi:hypothetical protein